MLTRAFCCSGPSSFLLALEPDPLLDKHLVGRFRLACPEPQPDLNKHLGPVLPASALGKAQPGAVQVNPGGEWEGGGTQAPAQGSAQPALGASCCFWSHQPSAQASASPSIKWT